MAEPPPSSPLADETPQAFYARMESLTRAGEDTLPSTDAVVPKDRARLARVGEGRSGVDRKLGLDDDGMNQPAPSSSSIECRDHASVPEVLSSIGMSNTGTTGVLLLCNLYDLKSLAPTLHAKYVMAKVPLGTLADLKSHFDTKHSELMKTILTASECEARKGVRLLGDAFSNLVLQHAMPAAIAQGFMFYALMSDPTHKKRALVEVFFETYLMVANVETHQFLLSCRSGIDLITLQLIQESGSKCCGNPQVWLD